MFEKWNKIPLRKKHIINIVDVEGVNMYEIKFTQCTAKETLEFFEMSEISKNIRLLSFIEKNGEYIYPEIKRKRWYIDLLWNRIRHNRQQYIKQKVNEILARNIQELSREIVSKAHQQHVTIYEGIYKATSKGEEKRKGILGANMMGICKEFNISGINTLIEEYTIEQIGWMGDMLTFNAYEQTKEGKSANNKLFGNE